jgi:hypothetical protein
VTQEERLKCLQSALAEVLPESMSWVPRSSNPPQGSSHGEREYSFDITSPARPDHQSLVVLLRSDGDIQVEYHMAGVEGSPFEALFSISEGQEAEAIGEVARFVHGLLTERLVLAMDPRSWRGGRLFLQADQLGQSQSRKLRWVTSWRGTYDRQL